MEIIARHKNARMTPRKVRDLRSMVVGLPVDEASASLALSSGKAAGLVHKILLAAAANARHNHEIEESNLRVKEVEVNDGLKFKRHRAVSKGMAHPFVKRASHIKVVLEEIKQSTGKRGAVKKTKMETLTADQFAAGEAETKIVEAEKEEGTGSQVKTKEKNIKVMGKIKMQQRGGEPTKTHRRKSI